MEVEVQETRSGVFLFISREQRESAGSACLSYGSRAPSKRSRNLRGCDNDEPPVNGGLRGSLGLVLRQNRTSTSVKKADGFVIVAASGGCSRS